MNNQDFIITNRYTIKSYTQDGLIPKSHNIEKDNLTEAVVAVCKDISAAQFRIAWQRIITYKGQKHAATTPHSGPLACFLSQDDIEKDPNGIPRNKLTGNRIQEGLILLDRDVQNIIAITRDGTFEQLSSEKTNNHSIALQRLLPRAALLDNMVKKEMNRGGAKCGNNLELTLYFDHPRHQRKIAYSIIPISQNPVDTITQAAKTNNSRYFQLSTSGNNDRDIELLGPRVFFLTKAFKRCFEDILAYKIGHITPQEDDFVFSKRTQALVGKIEGGDYISFQTPIRLSKNPDKILKLVAPAQTCG